MAINLQKGQRISLAKEAPGLTRLMCGLGWDVAKQGGFLGIFGGGGSNFDLDSSVICLNANEKLSNNKDVIYFGNLRHSSGAITHLGDNLTGAGEGDDEEILIDLPAVPGTINKLVIVVNIYQCVSRGQDFGQVNNAFVRLVDLANNKEIARYNLSGREYEGRTGMIMAEIYRQNGDWKMAAIGEGIRANGLEEIVRPYS
ncbi:TerD family protein [Oscillatoria sp. FACHB-1406]|uniref:TerD family protein n=1 Tax=Oscillatoria sp. FACHB-1406 TaxID=2692846 RepID=UPI0016854DEC|nr:TerD family protein [Oscillatoria sp. FACHB-1406]MBD2579551.1 TerD family protein [Oscillatoria sp. FACHB-1406]